MVQIALGSPIYFLGVGKVCHITVNVGTILKVSSQTQAKQKPARRKLLAGSITSKEEGSTYYQSNPDSTKKRRSIFEAVGCCLSLSLVENYQGLNLYDNVAVFSTNSHRSYKQ